MEGDVERLPYRYQDAPARRDMELRGPKGHQYEAAALHDIEQAFDELLAAEPETVLDARVIQDARRGRLAIGLTVHGSHAELHGKAKEWVRLLGDDDSVLDYEWAIGH